MRDTATWQVREAEAGIDDSVITRVMVEYFDWAHGRLLELYGVDDPPTDPRLVSQRLHEFHRPDGVLLLAERGGQVAGIGGLRRLADDVIEVRRMYVVPSFRGQHISSAILDRLIAEAGTMGASTLRLDTCRFMSDAQRLYRSRDFVERGRYEGSEVPARLEQHWMYFERGLAGPA